MKIIGFVSVTVVIIAMSMVLNGYALSVLWGWFIVPTFEVTPLTVPAAIGVAMVTAYLTKSMKIDDEVAEKEFGEVLVKSAFLAVMKPAFALTFGSVVNVWM